MFFSSYTSVNEKVLHLFFVFSSFCDPWGEKAVGWLLEHLSVGVCLEAIASVDGEMGIMIKHALLLEFRTEQHYSQPDFISC